MGLTCLHGSMTRSVLDDYKFTSGAARAAAQFNEAVDDKQGNTAADTNLHAMCGYDSGVMQSTENCKKAVNSLIASAEAEIVGNLQKNSFKDALKRLGEVLHTIQDLAFHKFEPWPYLGISDALLHDPNYMVCHAVRDVGYISRLEPSEFLQGRVDLEATLRPSPRYLRNVYLSGRVFSDQLWHGIATSANQTAPPFASSPAFDDRFRGSGFMISLTIGSAPRTHTSSAFGGGQERLGTEHKTITDCSAEGVESQARARDATADFIEGIHSKVISKDGGPAAWTGFLQYVP